MRKARLGLVACAACVLCFGASAGFAGEVDGKGNPVPGGNKGRSECSFSGQQDDPIADAGVFRGDRVQSWGQLPVAVRLFIMSLGWTPGSKEPFPFAAELGSCNPNAR